MVNNREFYQLFREEAREILQYVQQKLLNLWQNPKFPNIPNLMQAVTSIEFLRRGAAELNLTDVQTSAHPLENLLRSLQQKQVIDLDEVEADSAVEGRITFDSELKEELLQAYEVLWQSLLPYLYTNQLETARVSAEAEKPIIQREVQLDEVEAACGAMRERGSQGREVSSRHDPSPASRIVLPRSIVIGRSTFDSNQKIEVELPTIDEPEMDITESILNQDLPPVLEELAGILANPEVELTKLRKQIEVCLALGEILELSELVAIAQTALSALEISPQSAQTIGSLALVGLREACKPIFKDIFPPQVLAEKLSQIELKIEEEISSIPSQSEISEDLSLSLEPIVSEPSPTLSSDWIEKTDDTTVELTLKTANLLVWLAYSTIFTLPYDRIEANLLPQVEQIIQFGEQRFLQWQEQRIPIYQMSELLFNLPLPEVDSSQTRVATFSLEIGLMLIVKKGQQLIALESAIERLVTQSNLTVKPFDAAFALPSYCYGYSLWEDQSRVRVIDVTALLDQISGHPHTAIEPTFGTSK